VEVHTIPISTWLPVHIEPCCEAVCSPGGKGGSLEHRVVDFVVKACRSGFDRQVGIHV
jgi:hypothetical protein